MFEVTIVEIARTGFDKFVSLAPIFVSVAVFVVAALQWKTSSTAVKISDAVAAVSREQLEANRTAVDISKAVAEVGRQQLETNKTAVVIAKNKREDELFDRRVRALDGWVGLISAVEIQIQVGGTLPWSDVQVFSESGGPDARFLFDHELSIALIATYQILLDEFNKSSGANVATANLKTFEAAANSNHLLTRMIRHMNAFDVPDLTGD